MKTSATTPTTPVQPKVIYGDDNRKDLHEVTDPKVKELADSTVALFRASDVQEDGAVAHLSTDRYSVCQKEPYSDQQTGAFCSGSLVGDNLIMTAGHCISPGEEGRVKFVFGFGINEKGAGTPTEVSASQVYSAKQVLGSVQDSATGADWALVRLDRKVEGHKPLELNEDGEVQVGDAVTVIGHPAGLPTKVADGANVRKNSDKGYFVANLDTYGGNSGSAVFNSKTHKVEGILVRGERDFVWDSEDRCQVSNRVPNDGGRGEDVTKISQVREAIHAAREGNIAAAARYKAGSFSTARIEREVYSSVWAMIQEINSKDDVAEPAIVDRVFLNEQEEALLPPLFRQFAKAIRELTGEPVRNDALAQAVTRAVTDKLREAAGDSRSVDGRFIALDEIAGIASTDIRHVLVRAIETRYGAQMVAGNSYERFARQRLRLIGE